MPDIDLPVNGEKPWGDKLNEALDVLNGAIDFLNGLLDGGTTGQRLSKVSGTDYDLEWSDSPEGMPSAGSTGQALRKATDDDYDIEWVDPAAVTDVPDASTTVKGVSELATDAETITGTDTDRTTTPHGVAAAIGAVRGLYVAVNAQTGTTYTPVLGDVGGLVTLSNTGGITVTLPQDSSLAVPVGGRIDFAGINTGLVTFAAGSGATASATPSLVTRARYSAVTAVKIAANTWLVVGDLA